MNFTPGEEGFRANSTQHKVEPKTLNPKLNPAQSETRNPKPETQDPKLNPAQSENGC